jgi:LEA14-like dessication related protein
MLLSLILNGSLASCSYEEPTLTSFDGIEVIEMHEKDAEIQLKFTLKNPNKQKIKLSAAHFDISINSIFMGTAKLIEPQELPKNGEHSISLKMKLELEKSMAEIATSLGLAILTNNIHLSVVGKAKGSMGLFKKKFDINHTQKISWKDLQNMNL